MKSELLTKCSVCGADIIFPPGVDLVKCEYCLRVNDRPKSESNETSLMKYANERRNMGEFKEAEVAYRKVLQACPEEHEARWGLLLCKYGVMYVESNGLKERLITCRRALNASFRSEPDYKIVLNQAKDEVKNQYEQDAEYIDQVQAEIRRIREEEKPYDVFICYKETDEAGNRTEDSILAQGIHQTLERRGFRSFYAAVSLREKAGANYEAAIFAALSDAKVMLVLGTKKEYFESPWVRSEWKRYLEIIAEGEEKRLPETARSVKCKMYVRFVGTLDISASGRTVVKSRTVEPAVRPYPILILSRKSDIYMKTILKAVK